MSARSRLLNEIKEATRQQTNQDLRLIPSEEDIHQWTAYIRGPKGSPYQDGIFKLRIICPPSYPISPPQVVILTKCFHPNIDYKTGAICIDILNEGWTPAWSLHFVCLAIVSLLDSPNADSPLNCDAGNLIRQGDMRGFRSMARMYTEEYAKEEKIEGE